MAVDGYMSRYLALFCLLTFATSLWAGEVEIRSSDQSLHFGKSLQYWVAAEETVHLEQVVALEPDAWRSSPDDGGSFGYSDADYWFKIRLKNGERQEQSLLLEIAYPVLDEVDVYLVRNEELQQAFYLGDNRPFYDRPIQQRNFLVPFELEAGDHTDLYLRVKTTSSMQVPLTLWRQSAFHVSEQSRLLFQGIYYGIVLVMILYSLFIYLAVAERSFLYYVGYITCMPLFLACLHGLAFQYLWPEATWWNDQAIIFFLSGTLLFGCLFTVRFLSIYHHNHAIAHGFTMVIAVTSGIFMALALFVPYAVMIKPAIDLAVVVCTTLLLLGVLRWVKGDVAARYYTLAWVFMLSGGIILAFSKFTVLPRNFLTNNATQVGSALGVILLSVALADRLNKEKRTALLAQQEAVTHERKVRLAQEETLVIQREANVMLEARVRERTLELEELNQQLLQLSETDALTGLKNRGHFEKAFEAAYVRAYRHGTSLAVLVLDIDHFKQMNDTHGHMVGDDCLRMVAQSLRNAVSRPQDLAARYGGEEFVVLLPDTSLEGAGRVAEKIRTLIEETDFRIADQTLYITVSIGVAAEMPAAPSSPRHLFNQADEALYAAKGAGRNRVVLYDPGFGDKTSPKPVSV